MTRDLKLLMASLFLWGAGEGLFIFLYPLYLEQLGANAVAIGSIMSLSAAALPLTHVMAGWLADRLGRKALLIGGWVMACLATLLMFLAPTLAWFVPGLVLYMFTGYVMSPLSAYITEARGTLTVQRALTLVSASYAGGTIFSPTVAGRIAQVLGLRSVFGIALVAFVFSTGLMAAIRPQPVTPHAAGSQRYGALLASRRFVGLLALIFAVAAAFQVGLPLAANFAADVRRLDVGVIGLLGSCNALGMTVLSMALGHQPPRRAFLLAQALMGLSLGLLLGTGGLGWAALAFFCRGSWSLARNMATAQVELVVSKAELGLAYGLTEAVSALALILGPLAAGYLYARAPALPFEAGLGLLAVTLALSWRFAPQPAPGRGEAS